MEEETIIISALSTLSPPQLFHLTHSLLSLAHLHLRRLSAILSSPSLFSLTLHHLYSLSLPNKSLLIARHLLSFLRRLTVPFLPPPPPPSAAVNQRDLDAALLLLFLCETRQHNPESLQSPPSQWRVILNDLFSESVLSLSGIAVHGGSVLFPHIEMVIRCWRFVGAMGCGGKKDIEVAAAPAAVVALPTVEMSGGGEVECVICREEMRKGRDVCELPCQHLFHWMCILPWLRKRNTCPCCRFMLPTDDVFGEIQRLWEVLVKVAGGSLHRE